MFTTGRRGILMSEKYVRIRKSKEGVVNCHCDDGCIVHAHDQTQWTAGCNVCARLRKCIDAIEDLKNIGEEGTPKASA